MRTLWERIAINTPTYARPLTPALSPEYEGEGVRHLHPSAAEPNPLEVFSRDLGYHPAAMSFDRNSFDETLTSARRALLDARVAGGWWEGALSSSALSTATAVFAMHMFLEVATRLPPEQEKLVLDPNAEKSCRRLIAQGLAWLAMHQNADGGWGDTTLSLSNISTTALCWAALAADEPAPNAGYSNVAAAAEAWLMKHAGGVDPDHLVPAIIARYGKDRTFSVPILTMCALAGRLGQGPAAWALCPQLPFELAAFPQRWFKWLRLPVVSYALPALIAIGQVRHAKRPTRNPITRALRAATRRRTLRLLDRIQPATGGFLEATPLTSFVVMSLVGAGNVGHPVVRHGIEFLIRSALPDGSWPIDTNLATWVTTLSVNALATGPDFDTLLSEPDRQKIHDWLLAQQYRTEHPYTLADPGGWAWTDLPGGVPDADDTPGALLALHNLGIFDDRTKHAAIAGVQWLLSLQNRDGGIPTFCRGWGNLPFDRSSADLTAHTLRAWHAWREHLPNDLVKRVNDATQKGTAYLIRTQQPDGAWMPLWFGNQHTPDDVNPTYGTSRVLRAASIVPPDSADAAAWAQRLAGGVDWLLSAQHPGGGWGTGRDTPPSIEETALAVESLDSILREGLPAPAASITATHPLVELIDHDALSQAVSRGVAWLLTNTNRGSRFDPTPIGFYFAKLWYFEKLYPLIFTVAALGRVASGQLVASDTKSSPSSTHLSKAE
ncbi:MAG: shc 2 [Phycisphaerales bacterium]|nr:shc 2 [Phycisphaerales bacterium]